MELLPFLQEHLGGSATVSNGNWKIRSIKHMELGLSLLFRDSNDPTTCCLVSSKKYDALVFHKVMVEYVFSKRHNNDQSRKYLIDLRTRLHLAVKPVSKKQEKKHDATRSSLEAKLQLPKNSSLDVAKNDAIAIQRQVESQFKRDHQKIAADISANRLLNEWQVLGFFLGDGGVHVVWGTQTITLTLNFTKDTK